MNDRGSRHYQGWRFHRCFPGGRPRTLNGYVVSVQGKSRTDENLGRNRSCAYREGVASSRGRCNRAHQGRPGGGHRPSVRSSGSHSTSRLCQPWTACAGKNFEMRVIKGQQKTRKHRAVRKAGSSRSRCEGRKSQDHGGPGGRAVVMEGGRQRHHGNPLRSFRRPGPRPRLLHIIRPCPGVA